MSIKVIGAGFPRTGTNTLRESLTKLGYVKTYHMKELIVHPENLHYWETLSQTGTTNWEELYNGFQATVDFPCYPWYKEHLKQYPDAKVILTVRPFEDWHASVYSTIWQAQNPSESQRAAMGERLASDPHLRSVMQVMEFAKVHFMDVPFQGKFLDKELAEKAYNKHHEEVKKHVPAKQLLVFNVNEGWKPLCQFLGVPVPEESLPHTNKREDFKVMLGELFSGQLV
jgi:hypothetical protein